jgi:hypothetical protein
MNRADFLQEQPKSEDQLQALCHKYLNHNYPALRGMCFAVPNGGTRHKAEAMKLVATGVVAGIPDYLIVLPHGIVPIEFKFGDNGLTDRQEAIHAFWLKFQHVIHVCYSIKEFLDICDRYLSNWYEPKN